MYKRQALCALNADEIELNVGAGSLTAGALDAEEIELNVGAGYAGVTLDGGWSDYRYNTCLLYTSRCV